jgi:hypothetical protein
MTGDKQRRRGVTDCRKENQQAGCDDCKKQKKRVSPIWGLKNQAFSRVPACSKSQGMRSLYWHVLMSSVVFLLVLDVIYLFVLHMYAFVSRVFEAAEFNTERVC